MTFAPVAGIDPRPVWAAADDNADQDDGGPVVVVSDPLEKWNRAMFKFNDRAYFWVLKPIARAYGTVMPEPLRVGVNNAFDNVVFPVRFLNCTFQGKFKYAGKEFARFIINSTIGIAGMVDVAARDFNLPEKDEDTGQTLGYYGLGPGIYIVWPFFGPSNLRDTFGKAADGFMDPIYWVGLDWLEDAGITAGKYMNRLSLKIGEYEDFKAAAVDPYVSMRHAYMQYRAQQIKE
jgi:phospholipid-binding lipoprotein MlaA